MPKNYLYAFIMSFLAGLATNIGAIFIFKKKENNILYKSFSFTIGVMLFVSIVDLIPSSIKLIINRGLTNINITKLFIYIFIIIIIISLINLFKTHSNKNKLYKIGIINMLSIILHNIPEGIATFITSITNIKLGFNIFLSIMLHNIPEGISIALPIYYSTNNKKKAFTYTLISGLSEFIGSLLAYLFLLPIINDSIMAFLYILTAIIMIRISFKEMMPIALKSGYKCFIIYFTLGLLVMLLSHLLII